MVLPDDRRRSASSGVHHSPVRHDGGPSEPPPCSPPEMCLSSGRGGGQHLTSQPWVPSSHSSFEAVRRSRCRLWPLPRAQYANRARRRAPSSARNRGHLPGLGLRAVLPRVFDQVRSPAIQPPPRPHWRPSARAQPPLPTTHPAPPWARARRGTERRGEGPMICSTGWRGRRAFSNGDVGGLG